MEDAIIYERKKLKLKEFIKDMDEKCKSHFGPLNKYVYPKKNPYKYYADIEDFKKHALKGKDIKDYINNKHCKFIASASRKKDRKNRYYTDVQNERECDIVKGYWSPNSLNRYNKYDRGICWVSNQDKVCGSKISVIDPLRPYRGRYNPKIPDIILDESVKCNKTPGCKWEQQTMYTHDCVKDEGDDNQMVITPPQNLPLADFEQFLEDWYVKKKYGKAPQTGELFGRGDRCNGIDEKDEDTLISPPSQIPEYVSFRSLNPTDPKDIEVFKKYFTDEYLEKFKANWLQKKKMGSEKWKLHIQKIGYDPLKIVYDTVDKLQFESDFKYKGKVVKNVFLPSIPQSVINMVMKNVAQKNDKKRGLLAWHSTGSGKTCTATGVIDAFWDTDKDIIFASSIDAIASNPDFVFHKCAYNLFGRFQNEPFKGNNHEQSLSIIGQAFKKRRVRFLSFAKLSNRVVKAIAYKKEHKLGLGEIDASHRKILSGNDYVDLDNAILIIDEVHNLFRPLATQKKQHEALEAELVNPGNHPNLKVIILTATPGDNIPDVLKLLNIIRDSNKPTIKAPDITKTESIETFKKSIRGLISYFDMSYDDTKFPKVIDTPVVKLPMSDIQYEKYVEAYNKVSETQKNYANLAKKNELGKYWEPARKYANMLFKMEKDMQLSDFSSKLPYVLENIQKYPNEKQYLYSSFYTKVGYGGHGVIAVAKELEKIGYQKLTIEQAKKYNKEHKLPTPAKRYILAINTDLGEEGGDAGHNLHELLKIYNHKENKNGELIHIMLASNKYNESLDLKDVGHIHMFEPFVTMAAEKQAIGRAVRYCSFANKDRSKGEWKVHIHRYMAEKPYVDVISKTVMKNNLTSEIEKIEIDIENGANKELIKDLKKKIKEKRSELKKLEKKGKTNEHLLIEVVEHEMELEKATQVKDNLPVLKEQLKEKKKELKALEKKLEEKDIEDIEQRISDEAKERFKELFTVYNCMKEMAIDCRLLKDFHSSTSGQNIVCV